MIKKKQRKKKKAQVTVIDFGLSIFIFTIIIIVLVLTIYDYRDRFASRIEDEFILSTALGITDSFVKTKGVPGNWKNNTVQIIGLAYAEGVISERKVGEFCGNITYDNARSIMNLHYQFHFLLNSTAEDSKIIECGLKPENADKVILIKRPVVYQNEIAFLEFSLWK